VAGRRAAPRALAPLVRLGLPIGTQQALEFGAFGAVGLLMGRLGTVSMAGHQTALNLAALTFMVPLGVGAAAAVRVGHAVGAGDAPGARRAAGAALACGVGFMVASAIVLLAVPGALARLYTTDAAVLALAASLIPIAGVFQVFDGLQVVSLGVLRGAATRAARCSSTSSGSGSSGCRALAVLRARLGRAGGGGWRGWWWAARCGGAGGAVRRRLAGGCSAHAWLARAAGRRRAAVCTRPASRPRPLPRPPRGPRAPASARQPPARSPAAPAATTTRLLDVVGDRRIVLLGEGSHGTHEFYALRAEITRRLVEERGSTPWPSRATGPTRTACTAGMRGARARLDGARRARRLPPLPAVDVAQPDVSRSSTRCARTSARPGARAPGLLRARPVLAARLDRRGAALPRRGRPRRGAARAPPLRLLRALRRGPAGVRLRRELRPARVVRGRGGAAARRAAPRGPELRAPSGDARTSRRRRGGLLLGGAERAAGAGRGALLPQHVPRSRVELDLRDTHMADTLDALVAHLRGRGRAGKVVVWAHNSHLGDARATEMGAGGEINLGQLARERHPDDAVLVGFTTHAGTVTAAHDWGDPAQTMRVNPSLPGSIERALHDAAPWRAAVPLRGSEAADALRELLEPRALLERAIGVIYRPRTERQSHYFPRASAGSSTCSTTSTRRARWSRWTARRLAPRRRAAGDVPERALSVGRADRPRAPGARPSARGQRPADEDAGDLHESRSRRRGPRVRDLASAAQATPRRPSAAPPRARPTGRVAARAASHAPTGTRAEAGGHVGHACSEPRRAAGRAAPRWRRARGDERRRVPDERAAAQAPSRDHGE
jgi:hypothetical protein